MHLSRIRIEIVLFMFVASVQLITMGGHTFSPDEEERYLVTRGLIEQHSLAVSIPTRREAFISGDHIVLGKNYSKYGLGESIALLPLYLLGSWLALAFPPVAFDFITRFAISLLNPFVTALAAVLLFSTVRVLRFSRRSALLVAVIFSFFTIAWPYSKTTFSEPLTGLLILTSVYAAFTSKLTVPRELRWVFLSALALGIGALVRTDVLILMPLIAAYTTFTSIERPLTSQTALRLLRRALAFASGLSIGIIVILAYNFVRFGAPLETGYGSEMFGFVTPIRVGLYGLLLSPGRSIFIFSPPLVFVVLGLPAFWARWKSEFLLIFALAAAYTVVFAHWWAWAGGGVWGPRLLVPIIPILMITAGAFFDNIWMNRYVLKRAVTAMVLLISAIVQLEGITINAGSYNNSGAAPSEESIWFVPAYSPIVGHGWRLIDSLRYWWNYSGGGQADMVLLSGFERNSDSHPFENLPAWMGREGVVRLHLDGTVQNRIQLGYMDYRPSDSPSPQPQVLIGGDPFANPVASIDANYKHILSFESSSGSTRGNWTELTIRVTPWYQSVQTANDPAKMAVIERGIYLSDVAVNNVPVAIQERAIPLPPFSNSVALFGWFYDPKLMHLDFWWWYWYFSGLSKIVLVILIPLSITVLLSGIRLLQVIFQTKVEVLTGKHGLSTHRNRWLLRQSGNVLDLKYTVQSICTCHAFGSIV